MSSDVVCKECGEEFDTRRLYCPACGPEPEIERLRQERDEPKARVRELLNGISHTSTELVCKRAVETGEKQFLGLYVHPELGEVPIYVEAQMPLRETGA